MSDNDIVKNLDEQLEHRNSLLIKFIATENRKSEDLNDTRLLFHRERDRIVWSHSFKRLAGKTQVYLRKYGDHHRTRLTHSLEVMQLSTSLARSLGLNDALCETIALAHDLGHTPFGHAGEYALDDALKKIDLKPNLPKLKTFNHYEQGLDVVSYIDKKSSKLNINHKENEESDKKTEETTTIKPEKNPGLELSPEVREGILKHCWDLNPDSTVDTKSLGSLLSQTKHEIKNETSKYGSFESRIVRICDKVSYLISDIEDGLRIGAIHWDDIENISNKFEDELTAKLNKLGKKMEGEEAGNKKELQKYSNEEIVSIFKNLENESPKAGETEVDAFVRLRSGIVKVIMKQLEKYWSKDLLDIKKEIYKLMPEDEKEAEKYMASEKFKKMVNKIKQTNYFENPPIPLEVDLKLSYDNLQSGKLYSHSIIQRCNSRAKIIVSCMFCLYLRHPELVPWQYRQDYIDKSKPIGKRVREIYELHKDGEKEIDRVEVDLETWQSFLNNNTCLNCPPNRVKKIKECNPADIIAAKDYIAGMTDEFAERSFESIKIYCKGATDISQSSDFMLPRRIHATQAY